MTRFTTRPCRTGWCCSTASPAPPRTALLPLVEARGGQVLDLEGLANHRGSLLGGDPEEQPAQKGFESQLAERLARLDPERPVLVEAESSKIGASPCRPRSGR